MAKRILVVDDENDARMFVKLLLENSGFKVVAAPGGKEALKILKKEKFNLVLIDFFMPKMSGRVLLKKIRADNKLKKIKCVFLTVADFPKIGLDMLKKIGISDYIKKPFDNEDILKRVKKIIGN
ncbi:MAG: response regulator [Candidatus Aenigmarchaeota archaeon]|nr:response regulator [Candidatus Aenigmarchaeota archaeon]